MIETILITQKPLEKFYSKYFTFSYSSLNKLLHSAPMFYNWYILKERTDNLESYLIEGKVIHCLLLEEKMFEKQFIVMPGSIPGSSNKKIVHFMYTEWKNSGEPVNNLNAYEDQILKWLIDNDLHQKLGDDKDLTKVGAKTGDLKRLGKILEPKSLNYFDYLKKSGNKDVIDQEVLDRCKEAVLAVKQNKKVMSLLQSGQSGFELLEIFNEQKLACQLQGLPFGLKGIVDNYVIDHANKKVYVNDLKTTGKTLREFRDSVDYYKYWMQAAIYERLVKANNKSTKDYEFVFHFIVVDKYNQVYPFPVKKESLLEWQSQLEEVLKIAKYHYTNKNYTLPYEFAMDQVTL
tara:strand:+ start:11899 stop:12939 length:1041 start_codon:yes stop_codon:yes gene_type:complete